MEIRVLSVLAEMEIGVDWQIKQSNATLTFYMARLRRQLHFLRHYPAEVLWDIPFRIQQRLWMWWQGKKTIKI